jgi:hypothetical protein
MRNSKITLTGALIAFTWLVGFAQTAPVHCRTECAAQLITPMSSRRTICGRVRTIAGIAMAGMVLDGMCVARRDTIT